MLKPFFRKYGWKYLPGAILLIVCAWLGTRSPKLLGEAIDLIGGGDWAVFWHKVMLMVLVGAGIFVTRNAWRFFIIGNSREMEIVLRDQLYDHIQKLPVSFFSRTRTGDLMAYAINDVNAVRMTFGPGFAQLLNGVSSMVFSVSAMAAGVHPRLTFLSLLPVPLAVLAIVVISRQVRIRFRRVQELFAALSGHVQENIMGMRVLKAFAQEKAQKEAFEKECDTMRAANVSLNDASALLSPVIELIFGASFVIGMVYGGSLVLNHTISLGDYVAFNSYLVMIKGPVVSLGRIMNLFQRGLASYKRLDSVMSEPEIDAFERTPDNVPVSGRITARHLTFKYPDAPRPAVSDISFDLPEGGVLGIVGATGSGKSTILHLLVKTCKAQRGQLFVDGRDVCDIPAVSLRNAIGYVPQDGFLFDTSIEENIRFFSGCSDETLREAVRASGLERDLDSLPDGLETLCGERGNHLSGGQRQRTALARALARQPRILLLDDTLSAVDTRTEAFILGQLREQFRGRTAIIISHRLSAVQNADEILCLDDGRVAERGTHEALLALNGIYARFWNEQQKEAEKA
ncbi:MAG: ABC transporter ATP-binding protein [Clostridia bacterium]|nr:ABC transporter ATP-binding protein [Clostridia bacterium]